MSSPKKTILGIMSGTSLDGIDIAMLEVTGSSASTQFEVTGYRGYPYDDAVRERILAASHPKTSNVELLCSLNFELGVIYSAAVRKFMEDEQYTGPIDLVGLHGQTVYHIPQKPSSTLQIGTASQLAFDHHTTVVSNFREMDIAAGGEGAPLVPYTDFLIYRSDDKGILLQNIGGIGNVTVLPKASGIEDVWAFDTGPGNIMINAAAQYYYNQDYDKNGDYARKGHVIQELLDSLKEHPYLKLHPPKSTGREMFGETYVKTLCERYPEQADDVIRTLTDYAAYTIAHAYRTHIFAHTHIDTIILSGGGAYNPVLVEAIQNYLSEYSVFTQEDIGYSSDAKEAIAFALLANETIYGVANNVPSATGAKHAVILGQITPNPWPEDHIASQER